MLLKQGIVVAALLATVGMSWAGTGGLKPRVPIPKSPTALLRVPDDATGRLIIKFTDDVRARVEIDGSVRSLAHRSLDSANEIIDRFGLTVTPAINHPLEALAELERRAENYSGKAQPDLAGMMHVTGPEEVLLTAARALYRLDTIEFATFETKLYLADETPVGRPLGDRATGACCIPNDDETVFTCTVDTPINCLGAGGVYQGDDTVCGDDGCKACCLDAETCEVMVEDNCLAQGGGFLPDEPNCENVDCDEYDCGGSLTGLCWDNTNANICCSDELCCETVCEFDPFCCDEDNPFARWDDFCVAEANLVCAGHTTDGNPDAPDKCATPLNGSCFELHGYGGCFNNACCETVCDVLPICCSGSWFTYCIEAARTLCFEEDPAGDTPDFTSIQGYRSIAGYLMQLGEIPDELEPYIPIDVDTGTALLGYGGEGWDLFDDDDEYGGLYGLAQQLYDVYGIDATGEGVLIRGKTIKIAVIEWACYPDHEDLDVIVEPGQTLILEPPWVTNPDHGTACLGIANALENSYGMTGIAPEAQAYFFPLTSVEEGPRELAAWASALLTLEPGDVISASYGPFGGGNNLATTEATWTMIRLATDLGITACVAAGNECSDLSNAENLGDSGGFVVGACSPGWPYYRLSFSNFYTGGNWQPGGDGNTVQVSAWGEVVASTGYGDVYFAEGDHNRAYTAIFGGTSAATPQIAGLVACLQGLAKQFYGIPLTTDRLRLASVFGGWPQGAGFERFTGGFPDPGQRCMLDFDPDLGPFYIGPDESWGRRIYSYLVGDFDSCSAAILDQTFAGFDDSPLVDDIVVVRGEHIFGNVFSVKGRDNSYLVVEAQYTQRGDSPDPPGGGGGGGGGGGSIPEIAQISYLATGNITDAVIVGHADIPGVNSMAMESEMVDPGVFTLVFVEAYDWVAGRWSFVDVVWMNGETEEQGVDEYFVHTASATQRFVRGSDDRILFRMWTLGFSFGGGMGNSGGQSTYRQKLDWVNILVDEDFGEQLP